MGRQEIKIVVIGESGSGKSTMIRHLSKNPDELIWASSIDGQAGTTKVTVEYIFGGFNSIQVAGVKCSLKDISRNPEFKKYLERKLSSQKEDSEDYETQINICAQNYLNNKPIQGLFDEINTFNTFMYLSLNIPVNELLLESMNCNNIEELKVIDTRGLGDQDDVERVIPFAGTDAIMIVGKDSPPNPSIRNELIRICQEYSYIPVLFVGVHSFDEDGIMISSDSSDESYLKGVRHHNNSSDTIIKTLYADICEQHLKVIEPVSKAMKECTINHVPRVKSLANPKSIESKYYKFYQPACINVFSGCIRTISVYQKAQEDVKKLLNNQKRENTLFNSLNNNEILEAVIKILDVKPKYDDWYVDFLSVAKGYSERTNTPLEYSYNCVSATLRQMLFLSIRKATFSDNKIGDDIIKFFLTRVVQQHSCNWVLGWSSYHYIFDWKWKYEVVNNCKSRLQRQNLELCNVICRRFDKQYDSFVSIQVLLFEETLCLLMQDIFSDINVNQYLDSISNTAAI